MDHMDMGSTTTGTPTMTGMAEAATTSAMSMNSMMGGCKISVAITPIPSIMLWNWYTVDACFISRTWRVSSEGIFALTCIGVVLLVIALELVRRIQREFDRHIIRHASASAATFTTEDASTRKLADDGGSGPIIAAVQTPPPVRRLNTAPSRLARFIRPFSFQPSLWQQAVRGLLYMVQFAGAYFVMLLAMYYNGYVIICILIGAFLGFTLFGYDNLAPGGSHQETGTSCC
ncbi:hypothetical protein DRE_02109 [Drechslerella stenobrocha 248]|uniref:Copper transport protein n=1 Tax=Drechslerella stenobrocha 248 TaxID=1043628 RepID=W7IGL6_9PEZI|nr:hypothetical protein DRE_02109 [Drechslerella stenobrocha 248]